MVSTTAQLKVAHDVIKIKIQVNLIIKENHGGSVQVVLINVIGYNKIVTLNIITYVMIVISFEFLPNIVTREIGKYAMLCLIFGGV